MVEKRTEQKLGLLGKFEENKKEGHAKLLQTLAEQNEMARRRNQALLEDVTLEYYRSACGVLTVDEVENVKNYRGRNSGAKRLEEAKKNFVTLLERAATATHKSRLIQMEEKIKTIRDEEQDALLRAEKLRQQRLREEMLSLSIEKQRQQLLQTLAMEHHERLETEAAAIMRMEISRAADEAFQDHVLQDSEQVQQALRERLKAVETMRPPLGIPKFQAHQLTIPTVEDHNGTTALPISSAPISSISTSQGRVISVGSLGGDNVSTDRIQNPRDQSQLRDVSYVSSDQSSFNISQSIADYRSLAKKVQGVEFSAPNSPAPNAPVIPPHSSPTPTRPVPRTQDAIESPNVSGNMASSLPLDIGIALAPIETSTSAASDTVAAPTPTNKSPTPQGAQALQSSTSFSMASQGIEESDEFELESSPQKPIPYQSSPSPQKMGKGNTIAPPEVVDEFDIIHEPTKLSPTRTKASSPVKQDKKKSPVKPPRPNRDGHEEIHITLSGEDFPSCAKLLSALYPGVERSCRKAIDVTNAYTLDNSHRHVAKEHLLRYTKHRVDMGQMLSEVDESEYSHLVLVLVELLGPYLLPK